MIKALVVVALASALLACIGRSRGEVIERTTTTMPTKNVTWILYSDGGRHLLLLRDKHVLKDVKYEAGREARGLAGGNIADLPAPPRTRSVIFADTIQGIYEREVKELACGRWKILDSRPLSGSYELIHSESPKCMRESILNKSKKIEFDDQAAKDGHWIFTVTS